MLAVWLGWAAWADPVDDGEDLDFTDTPTSGGNAGRSGPILSTEDDDPGMVDFVAAEKKKAPPPVWWHVDPNGKEPLSDNFDLQVSAFNDQLVIAELPVLAANGRAAFVAQHPGGIVLIAEVTSGGTKQVLTQHVTPDAVFESGPTVVFFKTAIPNAATSGDVRFLVKVGDLPAPPATDPAGRPPKPPAPPAPPRDRFARTTVYLRR